MKNLVIVESPAKAKTINSYLGSDYEVTASFGHVRDLPKSDIGIDVENGFKPRYIIPTKAKKVVNDLKKRVAKAKTVYLATDLDREGEAIAWHIVHATGLEKLKTPAKRITFSEITKEAINDAVAHPREIDMDLVDAQQARRVLDRLVGYNLSPLLWRKIMKGLSAGRVQSVALRLVVEREREIDAFNPDEYWTIIAILQKDKIKFEARLSEIDGKKIDKFEIKSEKDAKAIEVMLEKGVYEVTEVIDKKEFKNPSAPFTTSTMQQDAANTFGFSAKQTMRLAQGLYEQGLITYMRTDSISISQSALVKINDFIKSSYGADYLSESGRAYKTKTARAQEAHECIRPTDVTKPAASLGGNLDSQATKLYDLIWRRTLASRMAKAQIDVLEVKTKNDKYRFSSRGQTISFDGYLKLYPNKFTTITLPNLKVADKPDFVEHKTEQHFTEPPARYSEATLIKALEEKGIGRPSTYAPTISTIQDRGYVVKDKGRLKPEKVGFVVSDLLVKNFSEIVDYSFTAKMEDDLDLVAEGKNKWQKIIGDFYVPFSKKIAEGEKNIEKTSMDEPTDEICPECGKNLVIKHSRNGRFYGCSGFPDCRFTKSYIDEATQPKIDQGNELVKDRKCPKCGGELKVARGKFGPFIGCSNYPECRYMERIPKTQVKD
jgi:DNA topoisomerase-1